MKLWIYKIKVIILRALFFLKSTLGRLTNWWMTRKPTKQKKSVMEYTYICMHSCKPVYKQYWNSKELQYPSYMHLQSSEDNFTHK